jgi:hypothetical protein
MPMPLTQETEVYRGPEGHVIKSEKETATAVAVDFKAVTAVGSYVRIYASKQASLKWLRKMEAKRLAKAQQFVRVESLTLGKPNLLETSDDLDKIRDRVSSYYAGASMTLIPTGDNTWKTVRTHDGKEFSDLLVTRRRGRFRLETI